MNSLMADVVGLYYYKGAAGLTVGMPVTLRHCPSNPHDANAIEVLRPDGTLIGHVSRGTATILAPILKRGAKTNSEIGWIHLSKPTRCGIKIVFEGQPGENSRDMPAAAHLPAFPEASKPSNSSCFVATVVFESPYHPTVCILRQWRDTRLAKFAIGRCFCRCYYIIGPRIAVLIKQMPFARPFFSRLLSWIASRIRLESNRR